MMHFDIRIRQATFEDLDSLVSLLKLLFTIEADFTVNDSNQRAGLKLMLEHPDDKCILVAEKNGNLIGMCTAQLLVTTAEGGKAALIEDVVILDSFRHQGIGQILMQNIEKWATLKGVKRLQLLADRENTPALNFYQKQNWVKTQLICLHKKP